MNFLENVKDFFVSIWSSYINFMTGIFGYSISVGITIVIVFILLSLLFLRIINKANQRN